MVTLFISDLHLDDQYLKNALLLRDLLLKYQPEVDAIYILGDLFERWIGDDEQTPMQQQVMALLRQLTSQGIPIYFMPGNRDFLVGTRFLAQSGCQLLPDPAVITLYNQVTVLTHGDTLCTHDVRYLRFRALIQHRLTKRFILALPLALRRQIAKWLRRASYQHVQQLAPSIMDVTPQAVDALLEQYQAQRLIHGHTHQPSIRLYWKTGQLKQHIVLSDWHQTGHALTVEADGVLRLQPFPFALLKRL